ncbi:MAG: bifunctional diaminohydroxyphosphoribosylaminopyrimidine deaminase/5-amino-6-(5-phosphoribosylamino)uracil reductase RibD [Alphaproteobacteria bacterium]
MASDVDIHHMKSALSLASRGLGRVWPNPSVGCVIVRDGCVVARARTADGGRPHAETQALEQAGAYANGATLYVTLEPCTHHGETAPCVDAIINAGIAHVVIGAKDVDPRVSGKSVGILESAGIRVTQNVMHDACHDINLGFFSRITEKRPFVTLKMACTLDGKIACASGQSKWITGDVARLHTHHVRSRHDAILIGSGTALADDPLLSTRIGGIDHKSVRIVLGDKSKIRPESNLISSAKDIPLWVFGDKGDECDAILSDMGAVVNSYDPYDLVSILENLAGKGITRILVEGGAQIHASFIKQDLFDELLIYRAPTMLGGDGISMIGDMGVNTLEKRHDLVKQYSRKLGSDVLESYKKKVNI